jgi:formylglycine-generating enzyme required for sulfatase activity
VEVEMMFAWAPPGKFLMGGHADESEKPAHEVAITRAYYLGVFPVTQAQWAWVMGRDERPSFFIGDDRPVEQVSRVECEEFCGRLRELTGQPVRLPTEAEWEYACRAGFMDDYGGGNDEQALTSVGWYWGNSERQTHPVGKKSANPWGLFDMHGNVWEWTADWFDPEYYRKGDNIDPRGPAVGEYPVLRGGSWADPPENCRAAFRYAGPEEFGCGNSIGFRVCFCPE